MTNETTKQHHFYASSVATWATTNDTRNLRDLMKLMDAEKLPYVLYLVPGPHTTDYEIRMYAPQVDGVTVLEFIDPRTARKAKTRK